MNASGKCQSTTDRVHTLNNTESHVVAFVWVYITQLKNRCRIPMVYSAWMKSELNRACMCRIAVILCSLIALANGYLINSLHYFCCLPVCFRWLQMLRMNHWTQATSDELPHGLRTITFSTHIYRTRVETTIWQWTFIWHFDKLWETSLFTLSWVHLFICFDMFFHSVFYVISKIKSENIHFW